MGWLEPIWYKPSGQPWVAVEAAALRRFEDLLLAIHGSALRVLRFEYLSWQEEAPVQPVLQIAL
jgi:hypothetical protein